MSSNKNRPRDPERVRHMLEAVKAIGQFMTGHSLSDFLANKLLQSAVERQFEILGEAASHVSTPTQTAWPNIDWREAKSFRNLIAHEYFRVDYATIWHVTQVTLP
ncbi:MAG: DUF86 domain-containing protein, partial [Bacteroidota bacterium]|nr:DUF86 domain-containing protein [Bacteroidota bacterium]